MELFFIILIILILIGCRPRRNSSMRINRNPKTPRPPRPRGQGVRNDTLE